MDEKLTELIRLSRELANPALNLAILGEGNTSADCEDGTFWVKASGSQLSTISENGFSRVHGKIVMSLMDKKNLDDDEVAEGLKNSLLELI